MRRDARILVQSDSTILDASDAALEILGLTIAELRALPPGGLSLEEDRAGSAEFEAAWNRAGRGTIVGAGTVRLLDGRLIRVRYSIRPLPDETFEVLLEPSEEAVTQPPRTYSVGAVLSAWRAAERKLEAIVPGSEEWAAVEAEVEYLRDEYQRVVRLEGSRPRPAR
jgi:PAS domain S-box-containing protein